MSGSQPRAGIRYLRFVVLVLVVVALAAVVGYLPTRRLGDLKAVEAMLGACGISVIASALGALPFTFAPETTPAGRLNLALGAMLLRMAVALILGIAAALSGLFEVRPLLIWLAMSYLILLPLDTGYAVTSQRRTQA